VAVVFIASFTVGPWQTTCYLVGPAPGGPCVVIDPGVGASGPLADVVAEHHLEPAGVLLTHGHVDHMFTAAEACERWDIGCWIDDADRHWLTDPYLLPGARELVAAALGEAPDFTDREPAEVHGVVAGEPITLADLTFTPYGAPGHTPGSTMFALDHPEDPSLSPLVFCGDVVFAGSVGRTDLPGGDPQVMAATLRDVVLALPDTAVLLPGHGPQTLMSRERATNPYLRDVGLLSS